MATLEIICDGHMLGPGKVLYSSVISLWDIKPMSQFGNFVSHNFFLSKEIFNRK